MNSKISLMALSVSLLASVESFAEMGPVRVNSGVGEPFSATITVSGPEARELLRGSKPSFSDSRLKANVRKSGGKAIVSLRSSGSINEPVIIFQMGIGGRSRQYTALIDPSNPQAKTIADDMKKSVAAGNNKNKPAEADKDDKDGKKQKTPPKEKNKEHSAQDDMPGLYVVEKGETLTTIAKKLKPEEWTEAQAINALIRANKGKLGHKRKNVLYSGLVLNLPPEMARNLSDAPPASDGDGGREGRPDDAAQADGTAEMPPQTPPPVPNGAAPAEKPADAGGEADWLKWLMAGGLGGVVAFLAFILYRQSKNNKGGEPPERKAKPKGKGAAKEKGKEKGIRTHKPVAKPKNPKGPITKEEAAAALAAQEGEADDWVDDSDLDLADDIVFFTDEPSAQPAKPAQGGGAPESFDLDLDALDIGQQQGIMSSAVTNDEETRKRQNADWDAIESTESIYEPDEFDFKKPAAKAATPPPAAAKPKPAAPAADDLDGFFDIPAAPPAAAQPAPAQTAPAADDLAFDIPAPFDEPAAPAKGGGTSVKSWASPAYSQAEHEAASWASADVFAKQQPAKPAAQPAPAQPQPSAGLEMVLEMEKPAAPAAAAADFSLDGAVGDGQPASLDISFDVPTLDEPAPAAPAPAPEPAKAAAEPEVSL
ncbi:MAG: hypothetical protein Q3966_08610, partial [Neisseria sp.]|nr:hypothetical protein [Neisseria sp.]